MRTVIEERIITATVNQNAISSRSTLRFNLLEISIDKLANRNINGNKLVQMYSIINFSQNVVFDIYGKVDLMESKI